MSEDDIESAVSIFVASLKPTTEETGMLGSMVEELSRESPGRYATRFRAALTHLCAADPPGSWIAEVDGQPAGFVVSVCRDGIWTLPMLFVDPTNQGQGIGWRLLQQALALTHPFERGFIMSSTDPRAIRTYARAGFQLHPTVKAAGIVRRDLAPSDDGVRKGSAADLDLVARVDRAVRGGSRAGDIGFLLEQGGQLLVMVGDAPGYAVHFEGDAITDGNPLLLAATSPEGAQQLLWAALCEIGPVVEVFGLTAHQQWAIEGLLGAGLSIAPGGPMFVKGIQPAPIGWIPSGVWF